MQRIEAFNNGLNQAFGKICVKMVYFVQLILVNEKYDIIPTQCRIMIRSTKLA